MWRGPAFEPAAIAESLSDYYLAKREFDVVGVMKLEMEDITFWPDVPSGDSLFVHRLAVRRAFSGGPISTALLDFARSEAIRRERRYLRLDCAADRPKLRNVYESFGFRYHSDKTVGTFTVARYEYKIK
jgi:GNAT superfamily N-acetyltransferase